METLVYIVLICLGLYFLFVKGFPWIASKYASYVFKGQVTISSLNFIRVTVKGVTLSKSSFTLHAGEISLSPNFFSHGYSSLLIARISNVEIVTFLDGSSEDKKVPGKGINLQQIVGYVCYMRFLVTVILNEVSVTLKNPKNLPGHDINIFFNKGHVFPESTKNGFVSLIAETEATELNIKPSQVKVKTANLKINTEIGLFPASVKSVEISVNNADGKLPVSFAAKFAKNGSKTSTIQPQESISNESLVMPDISVFFKDFNFTLLDDLYKQQDKEEIITRITALHLVKSQAEGTFGCSLDEFLVDFGKNKKPSMNLQKVLFNKTPETSVVNWAEYSIDSNLDEVTQVLRICDRVFPNNLTVKTVEFQLDDTRSVMEQSQIQLFVSGGHFQQCQNDLSGRLLIHELSGRFGKFSCSPDVLMSNCELDNLEVQFEKIQKDLSITASACTVYMAPEPLETLCRWAHQLKSRFKPKSGKAPPSGNERLRTGFRTDKLTFIFGLDNGLALKVETGTSKIKLKGGAKALGCNQLVLSLSEKPGKLIQRALYIPTVTMGLNASPKHVSISCPEQVELNWDPLTHKVSHEVMKTVQTILSENQLIENEHSPKQQDVPSTCQITFKNGIDLRTKLQDNTLQLKSTFIEFTRKGPTYWKLDIPSMVCDIIGHCEAFLTINKLTVERISSHPSAKRHRQDIEGCINAENSAVVVSMISCEFKFPHEVDVHHIVSTELLGIVKWLKSLHTKKETNWNAVHPDILIFAKEISVEFQDDPFEVNLRDNFELLEDEHYESMKRFKCLENKIEELKKTHLMIQTAKIDELYSNLAKKNSEIYVHRGKALREKGSKRTRLLSFNLASTEFLIFSDASMAGKDAIFDFIRSVDSDSPWNEDLSFTSAFCKWIHFECKSATIQLRDYPQPLADAKHILCWGKCAWAEQAPMDRAIRNQRINQGRPYYDDFILERSLMSFKFYHDIAMDMDYAAFAHGPCWEPTISQVSIAMSYASGRAQDRDPSPPLSSWDKLRYLLHGRLLCSVKTLKLLLHTTLDPYNTTEEVELTLSDASFDWTNAQIKCLAELNLFVRTASKYDDCQLLHLPNLTLTVQLNWLCMGNPNDHHSVMLCAREKVPEYSHNIEHDSYRAFRSMNVNVHLSLETRKSAKTPDRPRLEMFSSTIRWMESLKWLFSGASRPIRKGKVFKNFQPQKQSFFRHFKKFQLSLSLHQLQFDYWTSASMTKGVLMNVAKGLSLSSEYSLKLVKVNDGLIHRPRSNWTTEYTNCQMGASDIWFQSSTKIEDQRHIEKSFFFSVEEVQYNRDINFEPKLQGPRSFATGFEKTGPQHFLTVVGARGAWTQSNRDMAFSLYDSWRRAHILRNQMSSEGLKIVNVQQNLQPQEVIPQTQAKIVAKEAVGQLSLSNLATWNEIVTVEKMVPEASDVGCSAVPIVYSEDLSTDIKKQDMEAITACSKEDIIGKNWLIRFINSQMLLKGCETQGHLILSAAKAELKSASHTPVWKDQALLSKNSWSGVLESMQYFATVIPDSEEVRAEQIMWLPKDKIEDQENAAEILRTTAAALSAETFPEIVGSGQSVGGVVSEIVGSSDSKFSPQLQRIVSRCKCEFFYVTYGDDSIEDVADRIPRRPEESPWLSDKEGSYVNAFSLIHYDLNVCTNSLQYSMILDVLNNLLLYTEPAIKSRSENYLRMKYQLMLSNLEDQRKPIIQLQTQIRQMVCQLRAKEREIFSIQQSDNHLKHEERLEILETDGQSLKEEINTKSEELDIRLRCLHEFQMSSNQKHFAHAGENRAELRRKSEIFFSRAQWRLTETDGQLGIADAAITNFLYTKNIMRDDSVEHLLEMGFVHVKNLLPGQVYADVIHPSDLPKEVPLDRHTALRVFCREKAPVGGISVKDHFEINLVPLTIGLTHVFLKKIMAFCFPEKVTNESGTDEPSSSKDKKKKAAKNKKGAASFYVESPLNKDDVEEMKVRAQQNKLFVYIKIPEVPLNVSYKGEKEKNKILDVANFLLQVPTIEYHNVTWTWLDLLMAVKNQIKDPLLSQAIKQKLSMRNVTGRSVGGTTEAQGSGGDDEMKAKLLLGTRPLVPKVPGKKP